MRPQREIRVIGDVAFVELTQGMIAIIDAADVDLVRNHLWYAYLSGGHYYAGRSENRRTITMHSVIFGPVADGNEIDHRDGDGLDNRRSNMREATKGQNMANRRRSPNVTGYKGVTFVPKLGRYLAVLYKDKQRHRFGYHSTPEEAARAYDAGAVLHFGEFAATNASMGRL